MTKGAWKSSFRPRWMILTLLIAAVVLALTHIPGQRIPRALQVRYLDKAEHIVAYGLIAGFFLLSLKRPVRPAVLLIGLAALAAFGALDEATQPLVHRVASIWDYASDLTGMAIACVLVGAGRLSGSSAALKRRHSAVRAESASKEDSPVR